MLVRIVVFVAGTKTVTAAIVDGGADLVGELAAPTELVDLIAVPAAQQAESRTEVHFPGSLRP
jgi:hypothetical protein